SFRAILITGASSGIGAALAESFAAPGVALVLCGRSATRLEAVAARCRARGADAEPLCLDVTDASATTTALAAADAARGFDLVVANAGISAGSGGGESADQLRRITATNVDGVINTLAPLVPALTGRRRGQLGLVSSLAGFRGFPGAPAYCASKAWLRVYGEALRAQLARHGVGVSVICPGFVATPMTAVNRFPMPFLMSAERAASIIRRGLARNRARIAFPWPMAALTWLLAALPPGWTDAALARLPDKPAAP
ncbi:MAG: SDR family NAD(P)-dependent oxidoreductase, partial [Alphaproteobacteria bacterium]|nr:SDR family NAD(P)-dependent oxidoreductase [Alphaproteobacteria bacterium]